MKNITTRKAEINEIEWINSQYKNVEFVESNFNNEYIVIAEVDNIKAGIGRLVVIDENNIELGGIYVFQEFRKIGVAGNIVDTLCNDNPFSEKTIWCLPFENLKKFYSDFGFANSNISKAPKEVTKKYEWCKKVYDKKVLLLSKINITK